MLLFDPADIGLIAAGLFGALFVAFWIWMLIECAVYEPNDGNIKAPWILIILVGNWIGALLYLFVRRPRRKAETGR
jgi:uncharacterized integral membrane protein